MTFPDAFWWGAGASSTAVDGVAPASDLSGGDHGDGSAPPAGDDHPATAAVRAQRLAGHGLRHLRVTLEWARLEPSNGHVDERAVEDLRLELATCREAGLEVWGCLHDGTLPGWFAVDERGFADARSRGYHWARHVDFVGEVFGDLVHGWVPVFEPTRWAHRGWIAGRRPPHRHDDAQGYAAAVEGAHLASVDAALRLRHDGRPVASAQWLVPLFPARPDPDSPAPAEAQAMVRPVDDALWGSWHRMLTQGVLQVGHRPPVEVERARDAFDVIGFTYRHAAAVRGDGALLRYPQAGEAGPDGQAVWSHGLGLALHHLAESLPGRPLLLAGLGLDTAHEGQREAYLRECLEIAAEAVDGGIDLRGLWWNVPFDPPGTGRPGLFDAAGDARPAAELLATAATGGAVPG